MGYKGAITILAGVAGVAAIGSIGLQRVAAISGHAAQKAATHHTPGMSATTPHHITPDAGLEPNMLAGALPTPANLRVEGIWDPIAKHCTDKLTWDSLKPGAKYRIYQYDVPIGTTTDTTFVIPPDRFVTALTYTITSVDEQGKESAPSNIVTAQGAGDPGRVARWTPPIPKAPTGVEAVPQWNNGHPQITLSWHGDQNSQTYGVYRDSKKIAEGVWSLYYIDESVKPGETHAYSVTGANVAAGKTRETAQSAAVNAQALTEPPVHGAIGKVQITSIVSNDDSALVSFAPVPGAADYRLYKKDRPDYVKYSGGSLSIESNGMDPDTGADLVVEAVDKLGPFQKMDGFMGPGSMNGDGSMRAAINGQGAPSNVPIVLARSDVFHAQCDSRKLNGQDAFFDNFRGNPLFKPVMSIDPLIAAANGGDPTNAKNRYVREYINDKWIIRNYWGDMDNTKIFVMARHFMDTVYDGGTPGSPIPPHNNNSSLVMIPRATADISGDKVLHVTFEVDSHFSSRRWIDVFVAAKGDPLIHAGKFSEAHQMPTVSGNLFRWEILAKGHEAQVYLGGVETKLLPGSDWKQFQATSRGGEARKIVSGQTANGTTEDLDKRHRFDLYLSRTHCRVEEHTDGGVSLLSAEADFPKGVALPFTDAQVYFVHQLYHTSNERAGAVTWQPSEVYWINHRPWADERHWDNMGFEVLPSFPG